VTSMWASSFRLFL